MSVTPDSDVIVFGVRRPREHRRACPTSRSGHCRSCLVPVLGHSWSGPPHAGTLARHPAGTIVQPDGGAVAFEIAPGAAARAVASGIRCKWAGVVPASWSG